MEDFTYEEALGEIQALLQKDVSVSVSVSGRAPDTIVPLAIVSGILNRATDADLATPAHGVTPPFPGDESIICWFNPDASEGSCIIIGKASFRSAERDDDGVLSIETTEARFSFVVNDDETREAFDRFMQK